LSTGGPTLAYEAPIINFFVAVKPGAYKKGIQLRLKTTDGAINRLQTSTVISRLNTLHSETVREESCEVVQNKELLGTGHLLRMMCITQEGKQTLRDSRTQFQIGAELEVTLTGHTLSERPEGNRD
jgi:hypothetical protein